MALRVVYVGTGEIGVPSYEALAGSPHELAAVVTQPDRPAGRGLELQPSPVKRAALRHHHTIFQPERISSEAALEQLRYLNPDVLVVCAYGQLLKPAVLELPRLACLNLHASLLPRHRGASCIQAAIRAGDAETGMTLMWMDRGLDTGDILLARTLAIRADETAGELHDRLALLAPELLLEGLALLEAGRAPRRPQDASLATYAPKLSREDGRIDWLWTSAAIGRHVRAMAPWPCASTAVTVDGLPRMLKVFRAAPGVETGGRPGEVLRLGPEGVLVRAGEGSIWLRELQVQGRARMAAEACARGLRLEPGAILG